MLSKWYMIKNFQIFWALTFSAIQTLRLSNFRTPLLPKEFPYMTFLLSPWSRARRRVVSPVYLRELSSLSRARFLELHQWRCWCLEFQAFWDPIRNPLQIAWSHFWTSANDPMDWKIKRSKSEAKEEVTRCQATDSFLSTMYYARMIISFDV